MIQTTGLTFHQVTSSKYILQKLIIISDDDGNNQNRRTNEFVWSPVKIKRTTEEVATCDRATAEKIKFNFNMLYPECVGREQKVEPLVAKEMEKYLQATESNIQMIKNIKCKYNMSYNASCPLLSNSMLPCEGWIGEQNGTNDPCYQCKAVALLGDLEERCRIITNDVPPGNELNDANSVYMNVAEGQKRIDSILNFTAADPMVMHAIGWNRFGNLTRIVLLANICIQVSEDLFNKLKFDPLAMRQLPRAHITPGIAPIDPDAFIKVLETFQGKMLSNDSKKLHLDMIEGKFKMKSYYILTDL